MNIKMYPEGNACVDYLELKPEELKQTTGGERLTHDMLTPEEEAEDRRLTDELDWAYIRYTKGTGTLEEYWKALKIAQNYWDSLCIKHGKEVLG